VANGEGDDSTGVACPLGLRMKWDDNRREEGSPVSLALTDLNGNLSVKAYATKEVK